MSAAVDTYTTRPMGFEGTPAADAVRQLADRIADALGDGTVDPTTRDIDGLLEVPVFVTEGGVFGQDVITIQRPGNQVEVLLDDDALPVRQLMDLLRQLELHCIRRDAR